MPINVIMPALSVAQQTGTLLKWLKREGESIFKGEPLMAVETDKAMIEVEAPGSGVLTQVIAKAGDQVPVGQRLALILAPGEAPPREAVSTAPGRPERPASEAAPKPMANFASASVLVKSSSGRVLASPAAKRIAREKAVDLARLKGSGPEGSILSGDVLRAKADGVPSAAAEVNTQELDPITPLRRIIGTRMSQSKQNAPHFYLTIEIDMGSVVKLRAEWKERRAAQAPSLNDFILHACARALKDVPSLNSSFAEQGIKLHSDINLAMAVALKDGLVVPVIRNADRLSLAELAMASRELVEKAQKKRLLPLDCEHGTFTVTNLGMLGIDSFIAIINPPQCAILAVGRVAPRVVADDGLLAIKPLMTATLSADHRIVDGAIGAHFLKRVKHYLERSQLEAQRFR